MRCADWARAVALDPIGTAPPLEIVVVVEWPLPWPADVENLPELAPIRQRLAGRLGRIQLVAADPTRSESEVRVYRRPDDPGFRRYAARVATAARLGVVEAAVGLVDDSLQTGAAGDDSASGGTAGAGAAASDRLLLVCTHGRRDACCGRLGARLVAALDSGAPTARPVRRTSHLSGHRFAPTALLLPEGTMWAHLTSDSLRSVLAAGNPPPLDCYRGCTGLDHPAVQMLERCALEEVGTQLFHWERRGRSDATTASLEVTPLDGGCYEWRAAYAVAEAPTSIDCGTGAPTIGEIVRLGEVERVK